MDKEILLPIIVLFFIWGFSVSVVLGALKLHEKRYPFSVREKNAFFFYSLTTRFFGENSSIIYVCCSLSKTLAIIVLGALSVPHLQHAQWDFWALEILFILLSSWTFEILSFIVLSLKSTKTLSFFLFLGSVFLIISSLVSYPLVFLFRSIIGKKTKKVLLLEQLHNAVFDLLEAARFSGSLESSEKKLIRSVLNYKDRIVREVMVPRVDLFALECSTPIGNAAKQIIEEGYSRVPVYRDTIDNIVGLLMFKDILQPYLEWETNKNDPSFLDKPLEDFMKPLFFTPESKKLSTLMQEFKKYQIHMAIVVDEYGGTEGIVTLEDILEELVGEIADEYDEDEETFYKTENEGFCWIADGRMPIHEANEIFSITIPEEGEYDTLGGYVFHKLGSIPQRGVKIYREDFDLEVLSSTERTIEKIKISKRK